MNTSTTRRPRWGAAAALALVAGLFLTGCSAAADPDGSAPVSSTQQADSGATEDANLATLIDRGLQEVQSDFQREVLQKAKDTGELSEADWKEANNRFVQCAEDGGLEVELMYQGAEVQYISPAGEDSTEEQRAMENELVLECEMKTNAFIKEVYAYLNQSGGSGEDYAMERAIMACLVDRDLAPEDITFEQFMADLETGTSEFAPGASEEHAACWMENS